MHKRIATAILLLAANSTTAETSLDLGLIERVGTEVYFYFAEATLPGGSEVVAVDSGTRYRILGLSDPASSAPLVLIASKVAFPYTLSGASDVAAGIAAVVLADASDGLLRNLHTSSCVSSEGVHYSAWQHDGTHDVRVWSAYRNLDQVTEQTCASRELAD